MMLSIVRVTRIGLGILLLVVAVVRLVHLATSQGQREAGKTGQATTNPATIQQVPLDVV